MKAKNKLLTHAFFLLLNIVHFNYSRRAHHRPLLFVTEDEISGFCLATVVDMKKSIKTLFPNKQQLRESTTWLKKFPLICFIPLCSTLEVVKLVIFFYNHPNYL